MKRFRFRLEPVLRVRRVQEERARALLLDAHRAARETAAVLTTREHRYAHAERPGGVQPGHEYEYTLFRLDAAAGAVRFAEDAHVAALEIVEARRREWTAASQRVAALERLEERQRDVHRREARRDEDRLVDDLVVARHRLTRPGAPA